MENLSSNKTALVHAVKEYGCPTCLTLLSAPIPAPSQVVPGGWSVFKARVESIHGKYTDMIR